MGRAVDVAAYVERLCGVVAHGGRVMFGESGRVVVADVAQWTDDMSQCVKARFPGTQVSVYHCSSSISGFSVVIETGGHAWGGATAFFGWMAGFAVLASLSWWVLAVPE